MPTNNIFIHKDLLICFVPKAASTSLKSSVISFVSQRYNMAQNFTNKQPVHSLATLNKVGFLTLSQFLKKNYNGLCELQKFKKVIIVRHPFKRLLSAYFDKYLKVNDRKKFKYFYFIKHVRKKKKNRYISKIPKFDDFVDFIIDSKVPCHEKSNSHWAPYWQVCRTWQINYNYVIKFENLNEQIKNLWTLLFGEKNFKNEVLIHKNRGKFNTDKIFDKFLFLLNQKQKNDINNYYKLDFKNYNYSYI